MTAILSTYFVITLYNHKYNIRIAQFPKTFKHNLKKNYKKSFPNQLFRNQDKNIH